MGRAASLDQVVPAAGEAARLAAVRRYDVLTTPTDASFDRITAIAAQALRTPMSAISVVDADRIRFASRYGLPPLEAIARDPGLCASTILGSEPWVVTDAAADPRAMDHPLVAGQPELRFYAGVPLVTKDGHAIGTLCVLDTEPREISAQELAILVDLAGLVVDRLELRREARDRLLSEERAREEAESLAEALQASLLPATPPALPGMDVGSRFVAGESGLAVGGDFLDVFRLGGNDWALVLGDVCGKGARAASLTGLARWTLRGAAVHQFAPSAVLADLNAVLLADGDADDHFCTAVFGRLELDVCGAWVTLALSGHPQPVLVRHSGVVERRGLPSMPLGMFPNVRPVDDRVGLGPGDALVLFTDGIVEVRDTSGRQFGTSRLVEVLQETLASGAQVMADQVIEHARKHSAHGLTDDAAVLVVRVPLEARGTGVDRVLTATGLSMDDLRLPAYSHGGTAPAGAGEVDQDTDC